MNINCILIGDIDVGKTSLVCAYNDIYCHNEPRPTFDIHSSFKIEHHFVNLTIFDPARSEDIRKVRSDVYPRVDVFIICFSITDEISFLNVEKIWIPEMNNYRPNKPFILVGTKSDLKKKAKNREKISKIQGFQLKEKIGAFLYIECSALNKLNLNKVFESAALAVITSK